MQTEINWDHLKIEKSWGRSLSFAYDSLVSGEEVAKKKKIFMLLAFRQALPEENKKNLSLIISLYIYDM